LNRSTSAGAFCAGIFRELADQLAKFDNDPLIRAVVLAGDKEYFVCKLVVFLSQI
jgi:enoyl-CoA hydratase/carnithine racemase